MCMASVTETVAELLELGVWSKDAWAAGKR